MAQPFSAMLEECGYAAETHGRGLRQLAHVLTVAGSDSGAGAGIQADLKACAAAGVYCSSVITSVTAQNTVGVQISKSASFSSSALTRDCGVDLQNCHFSPHAPLVLIGKAMTCLQCT